MTYLDTIDAAKITLALEKFRTEGTYAEYVRNAGGDENFAFWLRLVDAKMRKAVGVTHRDIGDWQWRDAYDNGYTPFEAARGALEDDDTFGALFD